MTEHLDATFQIKKRAIDWFLWQLGLPLTTILLFGTLANWISGLQPPLLRAVANCDLILFSGLLLIGVAVALRQEQMSCAAISGDLGLDVRVQLCRLFAILIFGSVGFFRIRAGQALAPGAAFSDPLLVYTNSSVAALSVAFSAYGFWTTVNLRLGAFKHG